MVLSITLSHTHPHTPYTHIPHMHIHTHTTYTHPYTIHAVLSPTYQSSALPTLAVDVSAMRIHGASAVSIPTQPQQGQEEDTSHIPVAAEVLHGRRMKDTVTDTCVTLCSLNSLPILHAAPPPPQHISLILPTSPPHHSFLILPTPSQFSRPPHLPPPLTEHPNLTSGSAGPSEMLNDSVSQIGLTSAG